MREMITRYAPAPTGFLHLGQVVNAIYVWGVARARGGQVLLRIEDHDRQRSRPAFEAAIVEDLEWLGFRADAPMVRQSERGDIYSQALDRLRTQGRVYACACSRAEIEAATAALKGCATPDDAIDLEVSRDTVTGVAQAFRPADELWYPGTCRDRGLADGPGVGLRVRLEPTVERFVDLRHGPQEQRPSEQCGDLLVRDRAGNWTYQFVATVDDYVQGVTHVIRGDDLLASTGRQIQLARLLGRAGPPTFLHHPLIMKSPGLRERFASSSLRPGTPKPSAKAATQKLSKSDGDSGVRDLRAKGWTAERVIGYAASLVGLCEIEKELPAREVQNLV
jgi:glutamyl/glutaminyl-tRNA synthetase